MGKLVKISLVLLVAIIFLPTCKKINSSTSCLVVSASQLKRKIIFTYSSNAFLVRITDYADSTNFLSASIYNTTFNTSGQVSAVTEAHASGSFDSIAFDYSATSKIRQRQYILTNDVMELNYSRNYTYDASGLITSDTLYGLLPARKGLLVSSYTTYIYDADDNLITIDNYAPGGARNFNITYAYSDTLVENNSYNVARFTCMSHYGSDYQYVFPKINKLPSRILYTANGSTSTYDFTYNLDANKNAVVENTNVVTCFDCSRTTYYRYVCN